MSNDTTRLAQEYERVLELDGPGSLISVPEADGPAPEVYRIRYSCEGVTDVGADGTPCGAREHVLEVDLSRFPEGEPRMRFLTPVWHPGVAWGEERSVDLAGAVVSWDEVGSVAKSLVYVGGMLQYKLYRNWLGSPSPVKNPKAAEWLTEYAQPQGIIGPDMPLDPRELVEDASRAAGDGEAEEPHSEEVPTALNEVLSGLSTADSGGETSEKTSPVKEGAGIVAEAVHEESPTADSASASSGRGEHAVAAGGVVAAEVEVACVPLPAAGGAQGVDAEGIMLDAATPENDASANGDKAGKPKVIFGDLTEDEDSKPLPVSRLLHWKPTGRQPEVQEPPFKLIVTSEVLAKTHAHVSTDLVNELGGFLLGNRYLCPNTKVRFVQIDNYMPAKHASSGPISIEFMNETFQDFIDQKESKFRWKEALGWYHSHPDKGAFLSTKDDEVHRVRFPSQWTVALVIDPNKKEGGFFCWRDGKLGLHAMIDFYELREVRCPPTVTHMPWSNYKCFDSQTGEERAPQLAGVIDLRGATLAPGWHLRTLEWLKENRAFVGVAALLLLALFLGWRANLIGGTSRAASAAGIESPATTAGGASADAERGDAPGSSPATPSGQSLGAPTPAYRLFGCPGFKCKLAANFNERFDDLQAKMEGRPAAVSWNKNEAVVDLSNTEAMKNIKRPDTSTSMLVVYFSRANSQGAEIPVTVYLHREDALGPQSSAPKSGGGAKTKKPKGQRQPPKPADPWRNRRWD
jgi:proteasome lid subunit RPN8/RPN11